MTSPQIPLQLGFPPEQRFATFEPSGSEAVALLQAAAAARDQRFLVSGPPGCGKSMLLQATCAEAARLGRPFAYLPLLGLGTHAAAALEAQPAVDVLCVDGLDAIAGDPERERALFALHNRQTDAGGVIVYAARSGADALAIELPDLVSRLQHCTRLPLVPLDEAQRRDWLQRRAAQRGLQLDDAVLDYLFRNVGRDLGTLGALLDRLDRESLAAQRRITVPFLRGVLDAG
jgi:DnaA-homolog protein